MSKCWGNNSDHKYKNTVNHSLQHESESSFFTLSLDYFPANLEAISEEQRERFHQDIMEMERRYHGWWNMRMMANYC
jgi:hypothetical protein